MPNIDEVIKALDCCDKAKCHRCPYHCHCEEGDVWVIKNDARELLIEQKKLIEALQQVPALPEQVVRCRDCKQRHTLRCPVYPSFGYTKPDAYCYWAIPKGAEWD